MVESLLEILPVFQMISMIFRTRVVSRQIHDSENSGRSSTSRKGARSRLLQNRLKLWVRFDKRLIVEGVIVDGRVVTSPHDMSEALKAYGSPIFQFKEQNETHGIFFPDPRIRDGLLEFCLGSTS